MSAYDAIMFGDERSTGLIEIKRDPGIEGVDWSAWVMLAIRCLVTPRLPLLSLDLSVIKEYRHRSPDCLVPVCNSLQPLLMPLQDLPLELLDEICLYLSLIHI